MEHSLCTDKLQAAATVHFLWHKQFVNVCHFIFFLYQLQLHSPCKYATEMILKIAILKKGIGIKSEKYMQTIKLGIK